MLVVKGSYLTMTLSTPQFDTYNTIVTDYNMIVPMHHELRKLNTLWNSQ